jgi:outer membrane protein TolC
MSMRFPLKSISLAVAFAASVAAHAFNPALATLALRSLPIKAQAEGGHFDLKHTIDAAIAASAKVEIARRQVQLDAVKLSEAGSPLQPNITLNGSETRFDRPTVINFGPNSVTALRDHLEILQAQLTQSFDLLGHVRRARSAARLQQAADSADYESLKLQRALQAKLVYLDVLRAGHQVQVAEAALKTAQAQEQIAKKLYDGQVGQKIDYLRAQSNTAEAVYNLTSARNSFDVTRANFNNLVNKPLSTPFVLDDAPGVKVGADLESGLMEGVNPSQANLKLLSAPLANIEKVDIDSAIAQAQVRRPEILRATALVRAADVGVKIAHQSIEPSFSATLTGDRYPTTSLSYPRKGVASLTLAATFPVFDGGVARNEVQQATLRLEQDKTRLDSTKTDIALEVKSDYLNLKTAARQLESTNSNLLTAIAARQLAQVRYASQVGLFLEVTDAQSALLRAETEQVEALYAYFAAVAAYEAALGLPIAAQTNSLADFTSAFPNP